MSKESSTPSTHDTWKSLIQSIAPHVEIGVVGEIRKVPFSPEKKNPRRCAWCGEVLIQRSKEKGGRPRIFCCQKHGYLFKNFMKRKWKGTGK